MSLLFSPFADQARCPCHLEQPPQRETLQSTGGGRPEDRNVNLDRASGLERDLARTDDDLRAAQARRDLLAAQLQSTPWRELDPDGTSSDREAAKI